MKPENPYKTDEFGHKTCWQEGFKSCWNYLNTPCTDHKIIDEISGCKCGYPRHRYLCPQCIKEIEEEK